MVKCNGQQVLSVRSNASPTRRLHQATTWVDPAGVASCRVISSQTNQPYPMTSRTCSAKDFCYGPATMGGGGYNGLIPRCARFKCFPMTLICSVLVQPSVMPASCPCLSGNMTSTPARAAAGPTAARVKEGAEQRRPAPLPRCCVPPMAPAFAMHCFPQRWEGALAMSLIRASAKAAQTAVSASGCALQPEPASKHRYCATPTVSAPAIPCCPRLNRDVPAAPLI